MNTFQAILPALVAGLIHVPALHAQDRDHTPYQLTVKSTCDTQMRLAVYHSPRPGEWHSRYWYTVDPDDYFFLSSRDGNRLTHRIRDKYIILYAETEDGRGYFQTGDQPAQYAIFKLDGKLHVRGRPGGGEADHENKVFHMEVNCDAR